MKIIYIYIFIIIIFLIKKDVVVDGKAAAWGQYKAWAGREDEKRAPVNVWHFPAGILKLPKPLLVSLTSSH